MKCAVLSIGNELIEGYTLNTNATNFSKKLNELGISITCHLTLNDKEEDISRAIQLLNQENDLIVISGGLGPTSDDLTKEVLAKTLNRELKMNEVVLDELKAYFKEKQRPYSSTNDKQALFCDGDVILENKRGTACGYYFTQANTTYLVLPGPPFENAPMLDIFLKTLSNQEIFEADAFITKLGESRIETMIKDLYTKYSDCYIGTYSHGVGVSIRVKSSNKERVDQCIQEIKTIFKDRYLSNSVDPIQELASLLIENDLTISMAESCTAGLCVSTLANYPGISKVLSESFITYSANAKEAILGVDPSIIEEYGVVSLECANAMSNGLYDKTHCDICLSITGNAGPSVLEDKPAGLVYFSIHYKGKTYGFHDLLLGDRNQVRIKASKYVLYELLSLLKEGYNHA